MKHIKTILLISALLLSTLSAREKWDTGKKERFWGVMEKSAIAAIKKVSPKIVALSPHDSSDWCIDQFKQAFGDTYVDVKVGQKIEI